MSNHFKYTDQFCYFLRDPQLNLEGCRLCSTSILIPYQEPGLFQFHSGNEGSYPCHAECHAVGLQAYFGALGAADRGQAL